MKINYKNVLSNKKLKCTVPRQLILEILSKSKLPIRAEDIFNKVKNSVDEVTVYRTLSRFENVGIVRQVNLRKGSVYFELNDDHHHHLVCVKCGVIEDFKENNEIEKILGRIVEKSSQFKIINEHSLELFGVCKACI